MNYSYVEAIGIGFPGVECHAPGEGNVYEEIIWDGGLPLPSKQTLDTWIASNPKLSGDSKITIYAFRQRFTTAEKVAIELASIDNPSGTFEQRQFAALLRVVLHDLSVATFVDLSLPEVYQLVMLLEQNGLIASGRADIIVNTPPVAHELSTHIVA